MKKLQLPITLLLIYEMIALYIFIARICFFNCQYSNIHYYNTKDYFLICILIPIFIGIIWYWFPEIKIFIKNQKQIKIPTTEGIIIGIGESIKNLINECINILESNDTDD